VSRLVARLEECRSLLDDAGETHRSRRIVQAVAAYGSDEARLAQEVHGWFGGKGSFNDLFLLETNGHQVPPDRERRMNALLQSLASAIFHELRQ